VTFIRGVYVHHVQTGKLEKGPRITLEMNRRLAEKEILKELLCLSIKGKVGWLVAIRG